jgi:hypothetical protein
VLVEQNALHIHREDDDDDYADLGTINDYEEDDLEATDNAKSRYHYFLYLLIRVKSDIKSMREDSSLGKQGL